MTRSIAVCQAIFASIFFCGCACANHLDFGFDFGVKGGVPFTKVLESADIIKTPSFAFSQSTGYLVGPVAELRLPFGFAIEGDAIYRSAEARLTTDDITTRTDTSAWEIPYLAKFRFPIPLLKPFISGGGAYRTFPNLPSSISHTHNAFVLGGGLELRVKRLRLSGEARWLRWPKGSDTNGLVPAQNQGEVLFGIVF